MIRQSEAKGLERVIVEAHDLTLSPEEVRVLEGLTRGPVRLSGEYALAGITIKFKNLAFEVTDSMRPDDFETLKQVLLLRAKALTAQRQYLKTNPEATALHVILRTLTDWRKPEDLLSLPILLKQQYRPKPGQMQILSTLVTPPVRKVTPEEIERMRRQLWSSITTGELKGQDPRAVLDLLAQFFIEVGS